MNFFQKFNSNVEKSKILRNFVLLFEDLKKSYHKVHFSENNENYIQSINEYQNILKKFDKIKKFSESYGIQENINFIILIEDLENKGWLEFFDGTRLISFNELRSGVITKINKDISDDDMFDFNDDLEKIEIIKNNWLSLTKDKFDSELFTNFDKYILNKPSFLNDISYLFFNYISQNYQNWEELKNKGYVNLNWSWIFGLDFEEITNNLPEILPYIIDTIDEYENERGKMIVIANKIYNDLLESELSNKQIMSVCENIKIMSK